MLIIVNVTHSSENKRFHKTSKKFKLTLRCHSRLLVKGRYEGGMTAMCGLVCAVPARQEEEEAQLQQRGSVRGGMGRQGRHCMYPTLHVQTSPVYLLLLFHIYS